MVCGIWGERERELDKKPFAIIIQYNEWLFAGVVSGVYMLVSHY